MDNWHSEYGARFSAEAARGTYDAPRGLQTSHGVVHVQRAGLQRRVVRVRTLPFGHAPVTSAHLPYFPFQLKQSGLPSEVVRHFGSFSLPLPFPGLPLPFSSVR